MKKQSASLFPLRNHFYAKMTSHPFIAPANMQTIQPDLIKGFQNSIFARALMSKAHAKH